jgi:hypothetical protein
MLKIKITFAFNSKQGQALCYVIASTYNPF